MNILEDLFSMIPTGSWSVNENDQIVDSEKNIIKIESIHLTPVQKKLYSELLVESVNRMPHIMNQLGTYRHRAVGLYQEVKHVRTRIRESYNRGVAEAAALVHDITIHTPTARDALLEVSESMERLLKYD